MAGHTMTRVTDSHLVVIGGITLTDYYTDQVHMFNTDTLQWSKLQLAGSGPTGKWGQGYLHIRRALPDCVMQTCS